MHTQKGRRWLTATMLMLAGCSGAGGYRGTDWTRGADGYRGPTNINQRQAVQRGNINEGVRQGDLTRGEADKLRDRQRAIASERRVARDDDGRIDPVERRKIKRKQRKAGSTIYQERHDGQER